MKDCQPASLETTVNLINLDAKMLNCYRNRALKERSLACHQLIANIKKLFTSKKSDK